MTADRLPGRPLKDAVKKVGWPERALVTLQVKQALTDACERHGIENRSDVLRLALFQFFLREKMMTPELAADETWASLRELGLL